MRGEWWGPTRSDRLVVTKWGGPLNEADRARSPFR